jgi:hypothetical protein
MFAVVVAWQLGGLSQQALGLMPVITWAFAICFIGITILTWMYFFTLAIVLSAAITLCLILEAWLAGR